MRPWNQHQAYRAVAGVDAGFNSASSVQPISSCHSCV